jgi:uncharacterized membrane protein
MTYLSFAWGAISLLFLIIAIKNKYKKEYIFSLLIALSFCICWLIAYYVHWGSFSPYKPFQGIL